MLREALRRMSAVIVATSSLAIGAARAVHLATIDSSSGSAVVRATGRLTELAVVRMTSLVLRSSCRVVSVTRRP